MWGNGGGRVYWGRKSFESTCGIVVAFSWAAIQEMDLKSHLDLYASLGWNSLLCHAEFLCPFFPKKATSLAINVLDELVEELRIRPCPIVFAAFSCAPKACLYKVFQIIEGTCEAHLNSDDNRLVRNCICGQIYDSGPSDVTSNMCAQFALHPTIMKVPGSLKIASGVARVVTSGLDALFLTKFEFQRSEYWDALHSSVHFGAPFLIMYSEYDDHAMYSNIFKFVERLQDTGGQVELIQWSGSPHVGLSKQHPIQYRSAIARLLERACKAYRQKSHRLEKEKENSDGISKLICELQNAAVGSNQSLRRVALSPSDHFYLPSSSEYESGGSSLENDVKGGKIQESIGAHGVLGQVFDVCVPKNVDGWDIKFSGSVNGKPVASARRRCSPLHALKFIRRSRL